MPPDALLRAAAVAGCLVVVGAAVWMVLQVVGLLTLVLFPLVVTLFATRALTPPVQWLRGRGWRPAPAAGLVLGAALLAVAGMVALIAPPLVEEFRDLGPTVEEGLGEVEDWLVEDSSFDISRTDVEDAKETVTDRAEEALESSQDQVAQGALLVVSGLAGLLLSLILTFFALKDGPRFLAWVDGVTPRRRRPEVRAVAAASWSGIGGYLRGAALLGTLEAIVIGVTMALAGAGLVIPVMLLTFAAAFVPIVGATVAGVIAVLVTLAAGGLVPALIVGVVVVVVQQLDNDLLAPWIYGKALELHPVVVLLAITTGTALFGFAGTVLAVPLTAAVTGSASAIRALRDDDAGEGDRGGDATAEVTIEDAADVPEEAEAVVAPADGPPGRA